MRGTAGTRSAGRPEGTSRWTRYRESRRVRCDRAARDDGARATKSVVGNRVMRSGARCTRRIGRVERRIRKAGGSEKPGRRAKDAQERKLSVSKGKWTDRCELETSASFDDPRARRGPPAETTRAQCSHHDAGRPCRAVHATGRPADQRNFSFRGELARSMEGRTESRDEPWRQNGQTHDP